MRIANEILMLLRSEKKYNREVSLQEPIGTDKEGNEISLIDVMETGEKEVSEIVAFHQDVARLYRLFGKCLKEKEQIVVRMRYGLFGTREYTQREIAEKMGISRSYVSRIEKSALKKLKEAFEKPEK